MLVYLSPEQLSDKLHWRFTPTSLETRALVERFTATLGPILRRAEGDVIVPSSVAKVLAERLRGCGVEVVDRESVMRREAEEAHDTEPWLEVAARAL